MSLPGLAMPPGLIAEELARIVPTDDGSVTFGSGVGGSHTFADKDIGLPEPGRHLIIGAAFSGGFQGTISALKVDGNDATPVVNEPGGIGGGGLWIIPHPTGTIATIEVTPSVNRFRCCIGVFAAYNLKSATAVATQSIGGNPAEGTLSVPAGGIAVGHAHAFQNPGGPPTHAWTGLNESFEETVTPTFASHSGACAAFPSAQAALAVSTAFSSLAGGGATVRLAAFR